MDLKFFKDFDLTNFWSECSYSSRDYIEGTIDDETVGSIENELGYKLPDSYIELMKTQNGGLVNRPCYPTDATDSWAEDHVAINGFMGVGKEKKYSLCGEMGSKFLIEKADYPASGIYIADCPSSGHQMILLDYSKCGKDGEPEVVGACRSRSGLQKNAFGKRF